MISQKDIMNLRETLYHTEKTVTSNVSVAQKAARRKLNLLELVEEMKNVTKACGITGYPRQQFHEIKRNLLIGQN